MDAVYLLFEIVHRWFSPVVIAAGGYRSQRQR
jgi:hypothetical protein